MNTHIILTRIDPVRRMDRRYSIAVQPSLLDPMAVVCVWGSRRSNYQRMQVHPATTREEAEQVAEKIVRGKLRRGYLPG